MMLSGPIVVSFSEDQIKEISLFWKNHLINTISQLPIADAAYKLWIHEETILAVDMTIVEALQQAYQNAGEEKCGAIIQFAANFHSTISRLFEHEYKKLRNQIEAAAKALAQTRESFRRFREETYLQAERYMNIDSDIVPLGKNSRGQ